jgi:phosphatidate cytidylyltransferase
MQSTLANIYIDILAALLFLLLFSFCGNRNELTKRVLTLIPLWTILCGAMMLGDIAVGILLSALLVMGVYEIAMNYRTSIIPHLIISAIMASVIICAPALRAYYLLIFFFASVLIFGCLSSINQNRIFAYFFNGLFIAPGIAALFAIYKLNPPMLVAFILLLQFNDGFGYLFGRKFGKTKLFKSISPNKTLEGYAFGCAGVLFALIALHAMTSAMGEKTISRNGILILRVIILGNAGDLLFSKIKRSLGIKDFSSLLPGHGGLLDRIDDILYAAPCLLLFLDAKLL